MKRVLCPKCDNYITFDETKYTEGKSFRICIRTIVKNNSVSVSENPN